jgi:hypothetical protein
VAQSLGGFRLLGSLGSALLFGASTPIAKLLLGITDPLLHAGLLYLGSGAGLALVATGVRSLGLGRSEALLRAPDLPWLAAIVLFGGVLGPALLMRGLTLTPASTGALLLNTEGLAACCLARDDAERERAAAAVKIWLLAQIENKRAAPASDIVETASDEPFAPERLAA